MLGLHTYPLHIKNKYVELQECVQGILTGLEPELGPIVESLRNFLAKQLEPFLALFHRPLPAI